MVHLVPFYLCACFLAGLAAVATMIAVIRRYPGRGLAWIMVFLLSMSLCVLGNLYKSYRALAISTAIGRDTYLVTTAMSALTSLQFVSIALYLHRYLGLRFRRAADLILASVGTANVILSASPLSVEFRPEAGVMMIHPPGMVGQIVNALLLAWSIALLFAFCRHHPDGRIRRLLRNMLVLTLAFLPGFAHDLFSIRSEMRLVRQPVIFAFYPLFFGILSIAVVLRGLHALYCGETGQGVGTLRIDPAILVRYGLTEKERQIIPMVLAGDGNKQIAHALGISVKTVNNHLYAIYRKMGINSRFELIPLLAPGTGSATGVSR